MAAAKVVIDKVVDVAMGTLPSIAHAKNLSTTPTMQQDNIPKTPLPPKPTAKKVQTTN